MKKLLAAAGLGVAVAIGSLTGAGAANAQSDETYFFDLQVAHGWSIWNPAGHVAKAYSVCSRLNYESGYEVTREVYYENGPWSWDSAHSFVNDATTALCPWQW